MMDSPIYRALKDTLGLAIEPVQLTRTLSCFVGFTVSQKLIAFTAPKWLDNTNREKWGEAMVALGHHLIVCSACIYVILFDNETEEIEQDKLYGFSDIVNLIFSISTGYFMWDTYAIASRQYLKRDPQMLIHSIVCTFTYLFGQFPFLHFYGVRFLLFELSSIPLQLRQLLLILESKRDGTIFKAVQNIFGVSFLCVRLLYGIPLSFDFWKRTIALLTGKLGLTAHSVGVVCFYFTANVILNFLNLFWFRFIAKKAFLK